MKLMDKILQVWRISKALPFIREGDHVLDIGCADGRFFEVLKAKRMNTHGMGIDPDLPTKVIKQEYVLLPGLFPDDLPEPKRYHVITLLAVLEHIPPDQQITLSRDIYTYLSSGGFVVITTPSPSVDKILAVLKAVGLIDGMALHEHYGFVPALTIELFENAGFSLLKSGKFQFGLNNLFVFQKAEFTLETIDHDPERKIQ